MYALRECHEEAAMMKQERRHRPGSVGNDGATAKVSNLKLI